MAKDIGYLINIPDKDHEDTGAFIRDALSHDLILKWAYILQDKDVYTEHDRSAQYFGLQRCWADGFEGMEKYASMQEYIQEKMSEPPRVGDKKTAIWRIVCIVDKKCEMKDIREWFALRNTPLAQFLDSRAQIADRLMCITHEDENSRLAGAHLYPDEEVISNFDFRTYINETGKPDPRAERIKDIFRPAPLKPDKHRY
jgi:hypothetical protein